MEGVADTRREPGMLVRVATEAGAGRPMAAQLAGKAAREAKEAIQRPELVAPAAGEGTEETPSFFLDLLGSTREMVAMEAKVAGGGTGTRPVPEVVAARAALSLPLLVERHPVTEMTRSQVQMERVPTAPILNRTLGRRLWGRGLRLSLSSISFGAFGASHEGGSSFMSHVTCSLLSWCQLKCTRRCSVRMALPVICDLGEA
jgi:hypothetical protein